MNKRRPALETATDVYSLSPQSTEGRLDVRKYDQIREIFGDENLATLLIHRGSRSPDPEKRIEMLEEMLKPIQVHVEKGCLYSKEPEMVVTHSHRGGSLDDEEREPVRRNIASNLYFKRCDGTWRHIRGESLRRPGP